MLALAPLVQSPDGRGVWSGSGPAFVWMWGGVSHSLSGARWLTDCEEAAIPVESPLSSCLIFVCPCSPLP